MEGTDGQVVIELPVEKEFARLLRLLVSGVASRMDFDLDGVDDLKIAVEEAFLMAMRYRVQSPLRVEFFLSDHRLQIDMTGIAEKVADADRSKENFGNFILGAVVDEAIFADFDEGNPQAFNLRLIKKTTIDS